MDSPSPDFKRIAPSPDDQGHQTARIAQPSLLATRNVVTKPSQVSVRQRLEVLSGVSGEQAAYINAAAGKAVTWTDVARQADRWRGLFGPGVVVALHAKDPVGFCRDYLAGLAAGVCIAPLDPRATTIEVGEMLDLLEVADVVVDSEDTAAEFKGWGLNVWISSNCGLRLLEYGSAARHGAPGFAALLPTSGTTGRPKLVPLTEPQLLRVAARVARHHQLTPHSRGYSPLPLFHVNAQVVGILSTMVAGGSLVVEDRFHASRFWEAAAEFEVNWLNLVPAILAILADGAAPPSAVSNRVRFARTASAPLPLAVLDRFESKSGIGVLETYGMTEAASQVASNPLASIERQPGSVGRANGVAVRIVDEERRELPIGEIGVIEIRGENVVHSYLGPGRIRIPARERDGWLQTNDLARSDARRFIYLVGRRDDVINRGGEKFHPREIEEVLLRDCRVRSAVVVGRPEQLLGEDPVAYVVTRSELNEASGLVLIDELLEQSRQALSPHKRPSNIILVDALPMGRTGKLDRRAVRGWAAEGQAPSISDQRDLLPVE